MFIDIDTCHSGDAIQMWDQELNHDIVKIITSTSCPHKTNLYLPMTLNYTVSMELFTGYYVDIGIPDAKLVNENAFKAINCSSTFEDINKCFLKFANVTEDVKDFIFLKEKKNR